MASVVDGGPTLSQHWFNVSCLLGSTRSAIKSQKVVTAYLKNRQLLLFAFEIPTGKGYMYIQWMMSLLASLARSLSTSKTLDHKWANDGPIFRVHRVFAGKDNRSPCNLIYAGSVTFVGHTASFVM